MTVYVLALVLLVLFRSICGTVRRPVEHESNSTGARLRLTTSWFILSGHYSGIMHNDQSVTSGAVHVETLEQIAIMPLKNCPSLTDGPCRSLIWK
ncbi:hypothetical protein ARMSODRAFT_967057 [Armillaria solidipes]|uniref:Secreted protein n=1 Tax=Armillaria solidipes TaxID=1076256 RepID=A0A2H3B8B2_9AGAR|nr:hypothetical protein ARMSODRAFT_967057 [Armillaria solidipes]